LSFTWLSLSRGQHRRRSSLRYERIAWRALVAGGVASVTALTLVAGDGAIRRKYRPARDVLDVDA